MDRVAHGKDRVEGRLAALEDRYGSFPVNQTTFTMSGPRYERVRELHGEFLVSAYVEVRNEDDEVLHIEDGGTLELPGVETDGGQQLEPEIRETVREDAGVECAIEEVEEANIAGIRNGDNPDAETFYNLIVVFSGSRSAGSVTERAEWQSTTEDVVPLQA